MERSRGLSFWIRFRVLSLRKLLEGFEECCRKEKEGRMVKVWEEEGRKFKLERRVNGAGRYVLCSVVDVETKRFCLVFPKGKGLLGRWVILAEKLWALGVVTQEEAKTEAALRVDSKTKVVTIEGKDEKCIGKKVEGEKKTFVDVAKEPVGRLGDASWLQVGRRGLRGREEGLDQCLVGMWGVGSVVETKMASFRKWGEHNWNLKKGVQVLKLGGPFFLLEFEDEKEAESVKRGTRCYKDKLLHLRVGVRRRGAWS